NQVPDNAGVKRISGESDAAIAEEIIGHSASLTDAWPGVQQRKVAGAAAEIADQNQLVMVERGFVIMSRRHRLQLEYHTLVAREAKGRGEALLGKTVILVCFRADKTYRPPYYGCVNADLELILGFFTQVPENPGDQILKPEAPPKHIRALQAAA